MKVLIIEDQYSLADAIAETLKKENFLVKIVTDGEMISDFNGFEYVISSAYNHKIIIADEPIGNLDKVDFSRNCNIIVQNSQNYTEINSVKWFRDFRENIDLCILI